MMKLNVMKEKFKFEKANSESSIESYEFIDSPPRTSLNYAANTGVVFKEKKNLQRLLSKEMVKISDKAKSCKAKFHRKLEAETKQILDFHD